MRKSYRNREIAIVLFLGFVLFSISFFAGTRIYKSTMPGSGLISSGEINKREGKVHIIVAKDIDINQDVVFNPYARDGKKIAYLTFDDGPSSTNTPKILKILKTSNVKATFFVIGNLAEENKNLIAEESADGNAIGNHTYSHVYNRIYANPEAFLAEI